MSSVSFIKHFFLFLSLLSAAEFTFAQDSTYKVNITSPTAASLGKYGDIPVGYHTGIPQISIPVYTLQHGPLSLPISLSYHAGGLKVLEPASWVGAGWALNAGGVITRTVVGEPDDRGTSSNNLEKGYYSDYGYNSYLFVPGGFPTANDGTSADDNKFYKGYKDGEPDLYFFNFNGYTGKFYFNDDRTPILVPEEDLKIVPDYSDDANNHGFQGFTIFTPDGVKYYFGKTGNTGSFAPVEISVPGSTQDGFQSAHECVTSWYLNKIVSADDRFAISLNYEQESYSYHTLSMYPIVNNAPSAGPGGAPTNIEYNLVKTFIQGVRLSSITTPNGTISFNTLSTARTDLSDYLNHSFYDNNNTEAKALESIQINNTDNSFSKKFTFTYSYFEDQSSLLYGYLGSAFYNQNLHSDKYRLRLDKIQEGSINGSLNVQPYIFSYYTETNNAYTQTGTNSFAPRRLNFAQDHWGFYNGQTSNSQLIPNYTHKSGNSITYIDGANRDAAFPAMRIGSLRSITYPTGGNTTFDYEANQTWVEYNKYKPNSFGNRSGGPGVGGQSSVPPLNANFAGYIYKITLDLNNTSTSTYNSASASFGGLYVSKTTKLHDEQYIQLSGNQTFSLSFSNLNGSEYATGSIEEETPVHFEENATVGGLRIQTITTNDGIYSDNNMVTSYNYNVGSQSSGILYSKPVYVVSIRNDDYGKVWEQYGHPKGCAVLYNAGAYFKSGGAILPMSNTQGNHIGYNEVKVSQTGNGYSIYRYYGSNYWDARISDVCVRSIDVTTCDESIPSYPFAPLPFEPKRGLLKYEGHFSNDVEIKSSMYNYTFVPDDITTPGLIAAYLSPLNFNVGTEYMLQSHKKTSMTTDEALYDVSSGSYIQTNTTKLFESSFHHSPTTTTVIYPDGNILISKAKYAQDFRVAACDALGSGLQTYNTSISAAETAFSTNRYTCTPQVEGINNCRYKLYQQYRRDKSLARIAYITIRRTNFSDPGNTFTANHNAAKTAADAELQPILELQDEYKNPVIETSTFKNSNLLSASFNRFDYGMNNSTFVYPNKLQTLFPSTLATTFINAETSSSGTSVTKDIRYTDEAFYKFNAGNPVEATGKDGVTTSYIWGYSNTLPVVKAVGVDAATLNAAYNAVSGDLSQLRAQPSLNNSLISTYTYLPLLSMTSETDPSGQVINYEYDKLGRLYLVKDNNGNVTKKYEYKYVGQ